MSSQAWLDEDEEEDEDRPLLSSGSSIPPRESVAPCTLVCACTCGMLAGILLRCLLGVLPTPSRVVPGAQNEPATSSRATDRPWPLMMGVISRETAGHARRQRLRAHYGQVPDVLVRFVVSEAFASEGKEPDLLGVPDGVGSSVTYKSLHYWLLVTTLYDARYYLKTDDVSPSRAPHLIAVCGTLSPHLSHLRLPPHPATGCCAQSAALARPPHRRRRRGGAQRGGARRGARHAAARAGG